MPKRDQTPPYEIMRSRAVGGGSVPVPRAGQADPAEPVSAQAEPGLPDPAPAVPTKAPWWVGSSAPLVLRVPRGLALLAVAGVLGVIVLAYFVGTIRGASSARPEPEEAGLGPRTGPSGFYLSSGDGYQGPVVEVPEDALTAERREPGLNYMQLITSKDKEDCVRLAEFFGAREVAIQVVPVHNKGLWVAYAVKRGYRGDELNSESCKRYEQQLRALGRAWKQHNGGRGTDLSTMFFKRYDG